MIYENQEEYLTPKDLEQKLKLSHSTVNKLIHTPGFPMVKLGRNIRIKAKDFDKFWESYTGKEFAM